MPLAGNVFGNENVSRTEAPYGAVAYFDVYSTG
jgi:hypothetical protein